MLKGSLHDRLDSDLSYGQVPFSLLSSCTLVVSGEDVRRARFPSAYVNGARGAAGVPASEKTRVWLRPAPRDKERSSLAGEGEC